MAKAAAIEEKKQTSHWLILILLALAQFMVVLDVSIVNVALPAIQQAFNMTQTSLQWIVTAYTLTFGGFLLLGGRAADLFGRRKMFLIGILLFTVASLASGAAQSEHMIILFRGLQGLAAAFMSPAALSIVLVTYKEGHERNVALSVWGAVAAGGAAVGVLLGGILTQYLDWRWIFFVNIPVGIGVIIAAWRVLDRHESTVEHNNLDLPGAILVTGGLMMLVYGLVKAPADGWTAPLSLLYFGIALVALIAFVINELRAKHPLMPMHIFKIRNLSGANAMQLFMTAGMFSIFFFTTLYLQQVLGYTPIKTGVSFLLIPVIIGLTATNVPRLIQKIGYKPILVVAPVIVSGGLFWLSHIPVNGTFWGDVAPGMALLAFGMGATFVSVTIAATSGVPHHLSGLASGLLNTSQQIGGALGLAVLTGIATSSSTRYLAALHLQGKPGQDAIAAATVHGFHEGFLIASTFGIFASLIALFVIQQQGKEEVPVPAEAIVTAH
ncbi:MAG: EmrB/QacA subfamily drug resistance transporter [Candidatus Saccharibacteria bacterium]|nr:EmrB/QacA subfamily drug resistance transporter [Candidatus Saccharibacteria bacterium]